MKRFASFLVFALALAVCIDSALGQAVQNPVSQPVGWEAMKGKDNEFTLYIPKGYMTAAKDEFYMGRSRTAARVSKSIILARYINGVVLMLEFYEGQIEGIEAELLEREKLKNAAASESGPFKIKKFSRNEGKNFEKIQLFAGKDSLYVLKTISLKEDDRVANAFLESVRIQTPAGIVSPNAPAGAKSTTLPKIMEAEYVRLDDSQAIEPSEADRKPIIIQRTSPKFTPDLRRGLGSIRIKLKALFSSSGKVANVEVLESTSATLNKAAIEAVKQTVFIPAEKDGKLVSVYQTIEHSFEMTSF